MSTMSNCTHRDSNLLVSILSVLMVILSEKLLKHLKTPKLKPINLLLSFVGLKKVKGLEKISKENSTGTGKIWDQSLTPVFKL
mgnify:CR=1 FL=1